MLQTTNQYISLHIYIYIPGPSRSCDLVQNQKPNFWGRKKPESNVKLEHQTPVIHQRLLGKLWILCRPLWAHTHLLQQCDACRPKRRRQPTKPPQSYQWRSMTTLWNKLQCWLWIQLDLGMYNPPACGHECATWDIALQRNPFDLHIPKKEDKWAWSKIQNRNRCFLRAKQGFGATILPRFQFGTKRFA